MPEVFVWNEISCLKIFLVYDLFCLYAYAWPCFVILSVLVQAYIEKEDSKKLKQKQRERMQPKMGKMDIDYQVPNFLGSLLILNRKIVHAFTSAWIFLVKY